MSTEITHNRIDYRPKKETEEIPFEASMPKYKPEVMQTMEEAEKISLDPSAKTYDSFYQILKELD